MATSSKRTSATCHASQVCSSQSPCPHCRPLLTRASAGDTQTLAQSLVGFLGPGAHKVLFETSEHLWWVWGLILNAILPLLLSYWGFSFALGCGVSFFGGIRFSSVQFISVQSLSYVQLFAIPWTAACQASLSIINSQSLLKLMSIELVMPSNQLIVCHPLLLLPSIFPSIRVFSNKSALYIRWPKYRSFSFIKSPSNEYSGWISFKMD